MAGMMFGARRFSCRHKLGANECDTSKHKDCSRGLIQGYVQAHSLPCLVMTPDDIAPDQPDSKVRPSVVRTVCCASCTLLVCVCVSIVCTALH